MVKGTKGRCDLFNYKCSYDESYTGQVKFDNYYANKIQFDEFGRICLTPSK